MVTVDNCYDKCVDNDCDDGDDSKADNDGAIMIMVITR